MTDERTTEKRTTGKAEEPAIGEAEALGWLTVNKWCEEVIGEVRGSAVAGRRLFPSNRSTIGGLLPARPANVVAFQAIDLLLHAAQGAAGVARRLAGEILGVAVAPGGPAPPVPAVDDIALPGPEAGAPPVKGRTRAPTPTDAYSATSTDMRIQAGEANASCSFVVENATNRTLHTVVFKVGFLISESGTSIPARDVTFNPAMFELPPRGSTRVEVRIRTADVDRGRYLGLAEAGRFRQVITLDVV